MQDISKVQAVAAFSGQGLVKVQPMPLAPLGAGDVQLRVVAAAINPVDIATASGKIIGGAVYPGLAQQVPTILGWDAAGVVECVGKDVAGWRVGDKVIVMVHQPACGYGVQAEQVIVPAELLAPWPEGQPAEKAAALPLAGLTATQAIDALRLLPGQTVLINGPLGAVGGFAVQLAVLAGARVVGVVSAADYKTARHLGVTHVVERGQRIDKNVRRLGLIIDAALDVVGGEVAEQTFQSVRNHGRFATTIPYLGPGLPTPARGITRQTVLIASDPPWLAKLSKLVATNKLRVGSVVMHPFKQAAKAYGLASAVKGKSILML